MRREWIEILDKKKRAYWNCSLPPCGGSGLKFEGLTKEEACQKVSLHAEGVD